MLGKERVINARIITWRYVSNLIVQKRENTGTLVSCILFVFHVNLPSLCSMPSSWWLKAGTGKNIYTMETGNHHMSGLFFSEELIIKHHPTNENNHSLRVFSYSTCLI